MHIFWLIYLIMIKHKMPFLCSQEGVNDHDAVSILILCINYNILVVIYQLSDGVNQM